MARARNIKPGFFKNEVLAEMPPETRLLFIGLWLLADREGRLEDRPRRIRAEVFPLEMIDAEPMLARLCADKFIVRYVVNGVRYIQIENFGKHQMPHHKEVQSVIPAPDGKAQITRHSYDVSKNTREAVFARDGVCCLRCGASENLSIDHIKPLGLGGDNSVENLQTLCSSCNSAKGKTIKDYRKTMLDPSLSQERINDGASCPPDSLIPDSLNLIPDTESKALGDSDESPAQVDGEQSGDQGSDQPADSAKAYSDDFDAFWREYPRRHRASPKPDAWKNWKARLKAGVPAQDLITAATNYRIEQEALGKAGTEYVKQPATFLGKGEHWTPYLGEQPPPTTTHSSAVLSVPTHTQEMYPDDHY